MDYISTNEIAEKWGISQRRVAFLCEEGRISGAMKVGKTWVVPANALKPEDGRRKHSSRRNQIYRNLEKKFHVIYPENKNATYTSLLNYSDDLEKPFQRWYRYKEGFSIDLVKHLIREYAKYEDGIILDPFAGSGSTILAALQSGYQGIGFEVNPFSCFLASCKLNNYSAEQAEEFKRAYEDILKKAPDSEREYRLPELSISSKVFQKGTEACYMRIESEIEAYPLSSEKVRGLLKLGWLSCLEGICNYRKAGNGLKFKKYVKPRAISSENIYDALYTQYRNMYQDISALQVKQGAKIYPVSCLEMESYVKKESVTGIIFSPPYANCFDYTEIYKLELWFGRFVESYEELKQLRNQSLHSHLNGTLDKEVESKSACLDMLLAELQGKTLWDKRIPDMLRMYYDDMFRVLEYCRQVLKPDGFCNIVVGNSAYGGVIFPADLILAAYAEQIGFYVDKIEVDRYIITSSQQYDITKESGNYLRESVVCLIKKQ